MKYFIITYKLLWNQNLNENDHIICVFPLNLMYYDNPINLNDIFIFKKTDDFYYWRIQRINDMKIMKVPTHDFWEHFCKLKIMLVDEFNNQIGFIYSQSIINKHDKIEIVEEING